MVSDQTYESIWDGLLEVTRVVRYFAILESKCRRRSNLVRLVLGVSGCGAFASAFNLLPEMSMAIFGASVSILVIYDFVFDPTRNLIQLNLVNSQLSEIEIKYRSLWERTRSGAESEEDALEKKEKIMLQMNNIASRCDHKLDSKVIEAAQEEAFKVEETRYATT